MKIFLNALVGLVVLCTTAWAVAALYFSPLLPEPWRPYGAAAYALVIIFIFFLLPRRRRPAAALAAFAILVICFFSIRPSNHRVWQTEVATAPYAEITGDLVTIHGVRNFEYRSETDFTPRWETRTYDLRKLDSVDVIAVYWAGKAIAHIMLSFGFEGKNYLAVSIETRKEQGESYSTLAGFFRQYELVYVAADERDVIGVRTTYRQPQEQVYVYRVRAPLANIRRGFLDYLRTMNEMRRQPRFYNTLTTNCTTSVLFHTRMNPESPPLSWKILLSGYVPEYLHELGRLSHHQSFAELEKISLVNGRAHAAGRDPSFSQRIREGLPRPKPWPDSRQTTGEVH